MPVRYRGMFVAALGAVVGICTLLSGCTFSVSMGQGGGGPGGGPYPASVPKELSKSTQIAYVIEPPDILTIELLRSLPDRPLTGERLVRSDGTVNLGFYGSVRVAGLTIDQARETVEGHLAAYIKNPKVNLDVFAYNSKAYYVLADGAGFGETAVRLPFTGNETVLDAVSAVGGLPPVSSKTRIWMARPGSAVMPINWIAITQCGDVSTNYQVQPGDRIYINSDPLLRFDTMVAKIINPWERMFGFTLLGASTVKTLQNMGRNTGGTGGTFQSTGAGF